MKALLGCTLAALTALLVGGCLPISAPAPTATPPAATVVAASTGISTVPAVAQASYATPVASGPQPVAAGTVDPAQVVAPPPETLRLPVPAGVAAVTGAFAEAYNANDARGVSWHASEDFRGYLDRLLQKGSPTWSGMADMALRGDMLKLTPGWVIAEKPGAVLVEGVLTVTRAVDRRVLRTEHVWFEAREQWESWVLVRFWIYGSDASDAVRLFLHPPR